MRIVIVEDHQMFREVIHKVCVDDFGHEVVGEAGEPQPTILLVEDQEMVRNTLMLLLKSEGYQVIAAANADEALPCLQSAENHVVLVIADLGLPGMDGIELIEVARRARPGLAALALSEITGMERIPDVRLLSKPMTRPALVEAVQQALRTARQER